ncbi:ATP-binding protein, partial [Salmonella enterica subsp. enterica serovar Lubbock]|nr:ATP-binding protein [Salmonella enterica subsp. enterica serovar Lubbock]
DFGKGVTGFQTCPLPICPPADADKLFRRFWRGDNARHTAGFGLGLSLVNAIALLHDGSASYRYADEHNIFSVRLPDSADS